MARFAQIWVDRRVKDAELTQRVLARLDGTSVEVLDKETVSQRTTGMQLSEGKRILWVTRFEGEMVKPCPATSQPYLCCRYMVINQATQCPMDCTYCILQGYLDNPLVTIHVNLSDVFAQVDALLESQPHRFFRFGTGELADSLALDDITDLSPVLTAFFASKRNALIELKTKTDRIENVLDCLPGNTIISWSMNPTEVVEAEEHRSTSIAQRLRAARQCQERGFLLGFHFDPILSIPDFDAQYRALIHQIFNTVDASRIAWISMGALRYPPLLKTVIQKRFTKTNIVHAEMIRGVDGKMRYPRPLRVDLFKKIYGWLMEYDPDLFVYFCMELPWVWDAVMGRHPESNADLDYQFAVSLHRRFPALDMDEPRRSDYREISND